MVVCQSYLGWDGTETICIKKKPMECEGSQAPRPSFSSWFGAHIKPHVPSAGHHSNILPITGGNRICPLGASISEMNSRLLPRWVEARPT